MSHSAAKYEWSVFIDESRELQLVVSGFLYPFLKPHFFFCTNHLELEFHLASHHLPSERNVDDRFFFSVSTIQKKYNNVCKDFVIMLLTKLSSPTAIVCSWNFVVPPIYIRNTK